MEIQESDIARLEKKIDAVYASVEKVRKYAQVMVIVTIVTILLPILIGALIVPTLMSTVGSMYAI
jgi:hypothetical protein